MEWACCQSSRPSGSPDPASKARRKCACFRRLLRWICWNCGSLGDLGRARNGWLIMRVHHGEAESKSALLDRRDWLRLMLGGVIGSGGGTAIARSAQSPAKETQSPAKDKGAPAPTPEAELAAVRDKLDQAKIGPLNTVHSAHYVGIGDAPQAFITIILADCEQLDEDYQRYFDSLGFHADQPDRPLIVIMFRDDRSFGRFFRLPSLLGAAAEGRPLQPAGIYDKRTNVLHVFDWRNVPIEPRASHRNMETLAHEGTHQLSFNTGLLNRAGDTPLCIVEGLGTHGEPRKVSGSSDFGRLNLRRMDDLARIQRRVPWIPARGLIGDDSILRAGNAARIMLGYAQSWLLVHYLIKEPAALPRFRQYLQAIASRVESDRRIEDAQAHLGDLDRLDQELRRYAIRLQLSLR